MIPLFVVDAFTKLPFAGNPAAVCFLDRCATDKWLQLVAREMNLSETAFVVPRGEAEFDLRWFTPRVEVDLCGHATLASAHAIWESGRAPRAGLTFHTRSGPLAATPHTTKLIELDFPAQPATVCDPPPGLLEALCVEAVAVARNASDYLVEVKHEPVLSRIQPDFRKLAEVECRGVIVTCRPIDPIYNFVSRFFAPRAGIDEDPVTGSAHCCLAEWWGEKLGKSEMIGWQRSERGGSVRVVRRANRVLIGGNAVTVSRGEVLVPLG